MAQDNSNVRRCGQVGEGEDDHVSMIDVLNEEARLQADANAVLGDSDEYNCTYAQGYLKRQALYACATCTPEGNAGICLACSYACHEGHDIYELYTKRSFKCDCGNEKFKGNKCQLYKEKKELNSRNRYNQNYRGLYCTCSRPYPDDDDSVEDEMIQCVVCEDWFHGRHLKTDVPDNSDYHEMICSGCMSKYSFLWAYHVQCSVTPVDSVEADGNSSVDIGLPSQETNGTARESSKCAENGANPETSRVSPSSPGTSGSGKRKDEGCQEGPSPKKQKTSSKDSPKKQKAGNSPQRTVECGRQTEETGARDDSECVLKSLQQRVVDQPECAVFWSEGWRSKLCQCGECMEMYEDRNIEFLIDDSDTMQAYEVRGSEKAASATAEEEADAAAFASMGRVQQIEVVRGVMDFKTELNEFLQGFVTEGKVVKESDIREFFQHMEQRRRERMQLPQNYNCR